MPSTTDDWDDFAGALGSNPPARQQPSNQATGTPSSPISPNPSIGRYADSGCPICHQIDRMAKVSAIVRAGTSSGSYSGTVTTFGKDNDSDSVGWTSLSGSSTTRLAQQLQIPVRPGGCLQGVLYVVGVFFLAFGIVCLALLMLMLIVVSGMDFNSPGLGDSVLTNTVQTFIYLLIGIFVISQARRIKNKHQKVDVPRWQAAQAKWHKSYYCERCDVVFQAGASPDPVHIDHFQAYLYRN